MAGHTRLLILLLTTFLSSTRPASAQSSLSNSTSACLRALSQSSQFSKFVSFVNEGGLVPGLLDAIANSQGGITVFAPTDGAWNGLSPLSATYLMTPANILVFQSLLFSHAVGQSLQAAQLQNNQTLISLSGEPLLMLRSNGTLQVDRFPISLPDAIITSDCIVHGFNGIIVPLSIPVDAGLVPTTPPVFGGPLPPAPAPAPIPAPAPAPQPGPAPAPAAFPCSTILEAAVNTGRYRQLVQVLQATGLDLAIRTLTIPVTIFAPTDDAFNAIPSTLLVKLGASSDTLQRILLYHVADGYHAAASLLNRGNLTLSSELQGLPIPIFSPNQTTVVVGPPGSEGVVTEPDLALVNPVCVLHGISTVMIPPGFIFPGAPAPAPSQAGIAPAPEISAQNTTSTGTLTVPSATPTPRKGASAELSASFTSACLLSAFGLSLILL